jgi:hypothetical protein
MIPELTEDVSTRAEGASTMATVTSISDFQLRQADSIHTFDPQDPHAAGHQLWGHRSQESQIDPNPEQSILEIELPSDDHVALLALINRIERAKGSLPPDVKVLRRNLSS